MEMFEKRATSPVEARRLEHEAAVLRAVAHPGIVSLVSSAPDRLVLQRVDGRSFDQIGVVPIELLAGWAAAVATVVADLHDLGYVHGSLRADHVLIDTGGRPVLCGLGAARRPAAGADMATAAAADVADLIALIAGRLGSSAADAKLRRRLGRGRIGARALARHLVQWVPGAYVGPPVESAPVVAEERVPRRRPTRLAMLAGVGLAAASGVVVLAFMSLGGAAGKAASVMAVTGPDGPYRLVAASSERPSLVVGDWSCGPDRPAVLDARSGTVWVFDRWPSPGSPATGRRVARIPGAMRLEAGGGDGCARLIVDRRGGGPVTVAVAVEP